MAKAKKRAGVIPATPARRSRRETAQETPARRKSAAQNIPAGERGHGGDREGAGRPASKLPDELLAELGPMPDDVLDVAGWCRKLQGAVLLGVANGLPWKELSRHVDRSVRTIKDVVELEIECAAIKISNDEQDDTAAKMTPRDQAAPGPLEKEGGDVPTRALRRDPPRA